VEQLGPNVLDGSELVIDAVFGAGLARPLEGAIRATVAQIRARKLDCLAVDLPSGVHGDTGAVLGDAPQASLTVTFFRKKPGHLWLPARMGCRETIVADIGIPDVVLDSINPSSFENSPALWLESFPEPQLDDHKYRRGHAVIYGGSQITGAGRLAAPAATRRGARPFTLSSAPEAALIYAMAAPGHLVRILQPDGAIPEAVLSDARITAILIGPGAGLGEATCRRVLSALSAGKPLVVDADALTAFSENPSVLLA